MALGTVSPWGKVIECEWGYKAQYAYPHQIYLPASFGRIVGKVSPGFSLSAGVYASINKDEISLPVPLDFGGQRGRILHLKNSGFIITQDFPYEVWFYDLAPSAGSLMSLPWRFLTFRFLPHFLQKIPGLPADRESGGFT